MVTQLFIVIGANSGLGLETARRLAALPASTVILACRDPDKARVAQREILSTSAEADTVVMELDLSSLASVRRFVARSRQALGRPIDALICNAGISHGSGMTVDGIDPVFATNHLGHFLMVSSLLGQLAPNGRVLAVSSDMHQPPGRKLIWPGAESLASTGGGGRRYSYSKLCTLYFTYELTRRLQTAGSGIQAAAFNPGLMTETNFATMPRPVGSVMKRLFASRVGSLDTSSAALARLAGGADSIAGHYFDRGAPVPVRSSNLSYDVENAAELWDLSERLTAAA